MCFGISIGMSFANALDISTGTGMCMGMCICIGIALGSAKDNAINKQLE